MPRYFFNFQKDSRASDQVGVDLPDIAAARVEAVRSLSLDLKDSPDSFWDDEEWRVVVSDERGLVLFTIYASAMRSSATPDRSKRS